MTGTGTGQETSQVVRYDFGGMGMIVRYPVAARLGGGGGGSGGIGIVGRDMGVDITHQEHQAKASDSNENSDNDIEYHSTLIYSGAQIIDSHPTLTDHQPHPAFKATLPKSEPESPDRTRFVMIKVHSLSRGIDINEVYFRLFFSRIQHCLFAPHLRGRFNLESPNLRQINDTYFDNLKGKLEPAIMAAKGLLRDIVSLVTREGRGLSSIGNEDGSVSVWLQSPSISSSGSGAGGHFKLDEESLDMVKKAKGESFLCMHE